MIGLNKELITINYSLDDAGMDTKSATVSINQLIDAS